MPHMVIYRSAEGKPAYHQADGLEDAVRFVEHARNHERVGEARIFAMQEVPLEFKTYYRVEVASPEAAHGHEGELVSGPAPAPATPAVSAPEAVREPSKPDPVVSPSMNGSGRFGLFGKG